MTDIPRSADALAPEHVTTAFDLPGHTIVRSLGVAQGIVVRSRSIVGSFGASLQTLFGGNITLYTSLCEKARQHAFDKMLADARERGANAIVAMRYDSTELGSGVTEVICYGTAVQVAHDAGR
ncbi:YbjQ family protein [Burkholderia stagnalis]